MKRSFVLAVLGGIISTTSLHAAEPKPGMFGLGWYSLSAPIGGRVWATPRVGVDLGLGYADKNLLGAANDRFHVNVGVPVNVVMTEKANFFIRPGIELQTNARTVGTDVKSKMIITADLGVEWFGRHVRCFGAASAEFRECGLPLLPQLDQPWPPTMGGHIFSHNDTRIESINLKFPVKKVIGTTAALALLVGCQSDDATTSPRIS